MKEYNVVENTLDESKEIARLVYVGAAFIANAVLVAATGLSGKSKDKPQHEWETSEHWEFVDHVRYSARQVSARPDREIVDVWLRQAGNYLSACQKAGRLHNVWVMTDRLCLDAACYCVATLGDEGCNKERRIEGDGVDEEAATYWLPTVRAICRWYAENVMELKSLTIPNDISELDDDD